jgi:hypothetical protein
MLRKSVLFILSEGSVGVWCRPRGGRIPARSVERLDSTWRLCRLSTLTSRIERTTQELPWVVIQLPRKDNRPYPFATMMRSDKGGLHKDIRLRESILR